MEKDMKFTTAGEWAEDFRWVLSPHGRQKHTAEYIIEKYAERDDYLDNTTVQRLVTASKQVLADEESEEKSSLYNTKLLPSETSVVQHD